MPLSLHLCWAWCLLCLLWVALVAPLHAQPAQPTQPAQPAQPAQTAQPPADAARQRLALVIGIGSYGQRLLLESARRDSEAVAVALRLGGFEVLLREDLNGNDLRAAFKDFRDKLRADGVGLIYITALAAQVDGRNLLLPADVPLNDLQPAPSVATVLRAAGLPLQEAVDALAGGLQSPRLLLVDAAYRHPALARLTPPGLARQRLAGNTMVLLGHAPAALQDMPSVSLLSKPPPQDPRELAATRFARVVVDALTTPRISGPEALRAIRLAVLDGSGGLTQPWLAGDTDSREYLANATRLEAPAPPAAATATPVAAALPVPVPAPVAVPALTVAAPTLPDPDRRATDGRTAAAPGRGERPVYQARSNSFGHAEGDVFTYQVTDTRKDELLLTYTLAIDEVRPDGSLLANGGQMQLDAQARPTLQRSADGSQTSYEPAQDLWWSRPQAGESRAVSFVESYVRADKSRGRIVWRGTAQVGNLRLMETPAGDHDVLPIKTTGQGVDTPEGGKPVAMQLVRTVFFAPKLGVPVAIEIEDNDASGRPLRRERIELMHAQQSRTAN